MQIVRPSLHAIDTINGSIRYFIDNKKYEVSLDYMEDPYRDFPIDLDLFNILLSILDSAQHNTALDLTRGIQVKTLELFLNIIVKDLAGFNPVIKVTYHYNGDDMRLLCTINNDINLIQFDKRIPCHNLRQIFFYYEELKSHIIHLWVDKTQRQLKRILEQ